MRRSKADRLSERLDALRGRPCKPKELQKLARAFGRKQKKRGKEPTWVSERFPDLKPLSIPSHPGDLPRGTSNSVLNHLETYDLAAYREVFGENEEESDE